MVYLYIIDPIKTLPNGSSSLTTNYRSEAGYLSMLNENADFNEADAAAMFELRGYCYYL